MRAEYTIGIAYIYKSLFLWGYIVKQWVVLMILTVSSLGAMDTAPGGWRNEVAKLKALLTSPGQPATFYNDAKTKLGMVARNALTKIFIVSYPKQQEVFDLLEQVPEVLWLPPSNATSNWIVCALRGASLAKDPAQADVFDNLATFLFNCMKQAALRTNNYAQELASLLHDKNPITEACEYRREKVLRVLLIDINVTWRGSKDSQSPIEWANKQVEGNTSYQQTAANLQLLSGKTNSTPPKLGPNTYAENFPYAQIIIQKYQQVQAQTAQQYHQYDPQPHTHGIPGPQLDTTSEQSIFVNRFWKKAVLCALAVCACKMFYNWYYQQPDIESDAHDDEDCWQSER